MEGNTSFHLTHLGEPNCDIYPLYEIRDVFKKRHCGPCYFRDGFSEELPTRMTIKEFSGLFGSPQMDPKLEAHLTISMGLLPPQPGESLRDYRKRREANGYSKPTPKLFPFISALWKLMGYQPPLATTLLQFCQGESENSIAIINGHSILGVQVQLMKATRIAKQWT